MNEFDKQLYETMSFLNVCLKQDPVMSEHISPYGRYFEIGYDIFNGEQATLNSISSQIERLLRWRREDHQNEYFFQGRG